MIKIKHQLKEEDQDQKLSLDKELFLTVGIFKFYFVNGAYVRKYKNIDFCLAGHHRRYDFIPDNEFWLERNLLDQTLMQLDMKFDLLHEILENLVMALLGIDYDTAHSIYANGIEGFLRNDFKNGKSINESVFFKNIIKRLNEEVRIISPNEKTMIDNKWVRPGDYLSHYKFGVGQVMAIDLKSYSMPFITFLPITSKNEKDAAYRSAHEFKQLSGSELRNLHQK